MKICEEAMYLEREASKKRRDREKKQEEEEGAHCWPIKMQASENPAAGWVGGPFVII